MKKNYKAMTTEELINELDRLESAIFMEQMADFMDWSAYRRLKNEQNEVKAELKERE